MDRKPSQNNDDFSSTDHEECSDDSSRGSRPQCDHDCDDNRSESLKPILRCIKSEIERIEAILTSPKCGLPEIKSEVKNLEKTIENPTYGLKEIKNAIGSLEKNVDHSYSGLHKMICILKDVLQLLNNPTFGLKEIKAEVANIEDAVFNPYFGLKDIKIEIKQILSLLENPCIGLKEIKKEMKIIEDAVLSPTFGLKEIKSEVRAIENAVLSPTFGLQEIKSEVRAIEDILSSINIPTDLLLDIRTEIRNIEVAVLSPTFGLEEIKSEVAAIEDAVLSPTFGLEEIKSEIIEIINMMNGDDGDKDYTTGISIVDNSVNSIVAIIQNNTATPQTVTINLFGYNIDANDIPPPLSGDCTRQKINPVVGADVGIVILPGCFALRVYPFNPMSNPDNTFEIVYEVQFLDIAKGVTCWTGARTTVATAPISGSNWVPSNVYRFEELIRLF